MVVRRMTFDVDLAGARAVACEIDPALEPTEVARLHGGSTEVYRLDFAGDAPPLVLKLYPDEPAWAPAKEALVAGWIGEAAGVPIPRWLMVDESRARLPMAYAVITWLPGQTLRSLIGSPGAAGAYRQMGAVLRRVHAMPMPAFGYVLAEGIANPEAENAGYMGGAFVRAFRDFRGAGGDADLAGRLRRVADARFDVVRACMAPVLCHDDFQPGNVLAAPAPDGALALTGLLDFANAFAGDPLMDLAKAVMCCAHEDPASVGPLLEGYGSLDHPDAEGALWLYTLYHRLTMWAWLKRYGDTPDGLLRDLAGMAEGS
jgi:aminoglycoside phosphotransferase (APT) family kinase protein